MATLVRTVLGTASTLLQDDTPQYAGWREKDMVRWLNLGQRFIATYLIRSSTVVTSVKLAPGARQSIAAVASASNKLGRDFQGLELLEVSAHMGADGLTPGRAVVLVSKDELDAENRNWRAATASATPREYVFDPRAPRDFWIYPPAHATTAVWVEAMIAVAPADVPDGGEPGSEIYADGGASAATISLADTHVLDLVNFIVAMAYSQDQENGNQALAAQYASQVVSSINAQATLATGVNPNLKALPLTPQVPAAARI